MKRNKCNPILKPVQHRALTQEARMPAADTVVWSVTGLSMRRDYGRGQIFLLVGRWQHATPFFLTPLILASVSGLPFALEGSPAAVFAVIGILVAWFLLSAGLVAAEVFRSYPTAQTERISAATLTGMGVEVTDAEQSMFIPWGRVVGIRAIGGDVCFWLKKNQGRSIARTAFRDVQEARAFAEKAKELWKDPVPKTEDGPVPPPVTAYAPDVWPPPPRA